MHTTKEKVADLDLEMVRGGQGHPLLVLHGFQTLDPASPFLTALGKHASVVAPSHPGFGGSPRPKDFETVYDLVHLYLAQIDAMPHDKVSVLGLSFGGWLAAEIAVKAGRRLDKLILVDALGIKISDRETPDILDVFNTHPDKVVQHSWHDPATNGPDYDAMEDAQIITRARNWDALCLYGWHPYMYNPQLKRWLARIKAPTAVYWGATDGIVKPAYGEAYAKLIPGARFEQIANAGHHPEFEQPDVLAERVGHFLRS